MEPESLSLHTLASSLPAYQIAEKELTDNFKAAAQSITTLYKSSRENSKRAYNAGYEAACKDILTMIQTGIVCGTSEPSRQAQGGMTIGRVMDWVEARLEAIRSHEEEELQEQPSQPQPTPATSSPLLSTASARRRSPPRDSSRRSPPLNNNGPNNRSTVFKFDFPVSEPIAPQQPLVLPTIGSKRRHAMMMLDQPTTSTVTTTSSPSNASSNRSVPHTTRSLTQLSSSFPGTDRSASNTRRRTRSTRPALSNHTENVDASSTSGMDLDEDGRERKRVARR